MLIYVCTDFTAKAGNIQHLCKRIKLGQHYLPIYCNLMEISEKKWACMLKQSYWKIAIVYDFVICYLNFSGSSPASCSTSFKLILIISINLHLDILAWVKVIYSYVNLQVAYYFHCTYELNECRSSISLKFSNSCISPKLSLFFYKVFSPFLQIKKLYLANYFIIVSHNQFNR